MGGDRAEYPGRIGITRTYDRNRTNLSDLTDVDTGGVADGDLLQYDAGTQTWITISVVELADQITLNDLGDVVITSVQNGDILFWDGSDWVNGGLNLEDLLDVDLTGLADNDFLQYDLASDTWKVLSYTDLETSIINEVVDQLGGGYNDGQLIQTVGEAAGLRIIRGHVADSGAALHGGGYSSSNTATGRFSISYSYAFPEVPSVTVTAEYSGGANRMRCCAWTSCATGGFSVAIQEDVAGVWTDVDANFTFIVVGMAGNY